MSATPSLPTPGEVAPAPAPAARRSRRRRFAAWTAKSALAAVFGALVIGQLIALGVLLLAGGEDAPVWIVGATLLVTDAVTLAVVIAAARRGTERLAPSTLGLRRPRSGFWGSVGWLLVAWIAYIAAAGLYALAAGDPGSPQASGEGYADITLLGQVLLFLTIAVGAPIVEEVAFRGYLFAAIAGRRGPWTAAGITGALFGAAHIVVYPPVYLPPLMVMGVLLCLLFWFTGSLLPCIALHAFNNALVLGVESDWGAFTLVGIVAAIVVSLGLVLPLARERAAAPAPVPA